MRPQDPGAGLGHLQTGLVLLTAGIVLGLAGVAIFLAGEQSGARLAWRKSAIAAAALAAPLLFGGFALSLPARWPLRAVAGLGAGLNLTAVALFWTHYPAQFNAAGMGADKAPLDAAVYAAGSALLAGTLLAQVVAYALHRRGDTQADVWGDLPEVPDWLVEKDIDDALAKHPVAWGEGRQAPSTVELHIPSFGQGSVVRGHGVARQVEIPLAGLDRNSQRLRGMSAGSTEVQARPITEASAALAHLRRQQAEHPRSFRSPRRSWWRRLWRA